MTTATAINQTSPDAVVTAAAKNACYTDAEIRAGLAFSDRKARRAHPPGTSGKGRKFYADERTDTVLSAREPSWKWPFPEMTAARTAAHCAEVYKAESLLAVKRVGRARDLFESNPDVTEGELKQVLKPVR